MFEHGVRVQLFGPVRAWAGEEEVALRGVSARTVLARLALSSGAAVTISSLCDSLWGERELPSNPAANLQTVVSRLRRGMGAAAIRSVPGGYQLSDEVVVDVVLMRRCISSLNRRDSAHARDTLVQLIAGVEGPPLVGAALTIALAPDRAMLDELLLLARDTTVRLGLTAGDPDLVVIDACRNAEAAPLREQSQLLAAEALARSDRIAEALRTISRYRARLRDETGIEVSEATVALERSVLDGTIEASLTMPAMERVAASSTRWIPPDTPFEGRSDKLAELAELSSKARLVTIVGTGGVGKTRLAMEHLRAIGQTDVVVVELATLSRNRSITSAVGRALGIEPGQTALDRAIAERLTLIPTRLVLDNCEHVLKSCERLIRDLLQTVEHLTVLATSRQRIGLPEEQVLRIGPLAVKADGHIAPAIRVFTDRIARCSFDAAPTGEDAPLLAEITQLLDGLPLAIEVASPRVHLLGLEGLRDHLRSGESVIAAEGGLIAGTVRWSIDLLNEEAATLFHEVCIFPGTFGLDAVRAVSSLPEPLAAFSELVEASLVTVTGHGAQRFRLLEPVREAGALRTPPAATTAFVEWMLDLSEIIARGWQTDQPALCHERLDEHRHDLRVALSLLRDADRHRDAERLASRIARPLVIRSDLQLVEAILAVEAQHPEGRAARAALEWSLGRAPEAVATALAVLDELEPGDPLELLLLNSVAGACSFIGDLDRMIEFGVRLRRHPAAGATELAWAAGIEALGYCYKGEPDNAAAVLDLHDKPGSSDAGGFIAFARAEIAAGSNASSASEWLDIGAQQADAAGALMMRRMIDIARLALVMETGAFDAARPLARSIVEGLLASGLAVHGWMTLRHVATILANSDEPRLALLVLESANADPRAPVLHGDAAQADAEIRAELSSRQSNADSEEFTPPAPQGLTELWPTVAASLGPSAGD